MKLPVPVFAAALAAPFLAVSASGHHSYAMFDRGRTDTVVGTVKNFELINPHGWLQLMVRDAQGKEREWSLETGGPGQMARAGWQANTVTPGDKLTALIHPMKEGSYGGQLVSVKLANGQTLESH
ncbi:MAG TPA: DUF6152 family protein [Caulobacteraceae bacterium]|jgi:hypothetical protein|nr:DUF6152 family protein [Caulobacteraceae bacterium]